MDEQSSFVLDACLFVVRSVSRYHREHPYVLHAEGADHVVRYEPAESSSPIFGGNSNWRGPIWFPINYLLIESIQKFHHYYGDDFKVECPTGSGELLTLGQIADELSCRLIRIFLLDTAGRRPVYDDIAIFQQATHWRDHVLFFEYFNGDTGGRSRRQPSDRLDGTACEVNRAAGDARGEVHMNADVRLKHETEHG